MTIDRAKILKAAKCCLTIDPTAYDPCPKECPYREKIGKPCGFDPFLADIVAYLEKQEHEQEPVKTSNTLDGNGHLWRDCGMCGGVLPKNAQYCPTCGWRIKWDD